MSLVLGLGKDLLSYTFHECDMRVSRQLYLHLCSYHTICASVCVRVSLENYYYHNYCQLRQQRKATTTLGAQKVCTIMADKKSALAFNSTEFNSQHKHGPTAMHCPKKNPSAVCIKCKFNLQGKFLLWLCLRGVNGFQSETSNESFY